MFLFIGRALNIDNFNKAMNFCLYHFIDNSDKSSKSQKNKPENHPHEDSSL
jgi:hypothetical protein